MCSRWRCGGQERGMWCWARRGTYSMRAQYARPPPCRCGACCTRSATSPLHHVGQNRYPVATCRGQLTMERKCMVPCEIKFTGLAWVLLVPISAHSVCSNSSCWTIMTLNLCWCRSRWRDSRGRGWWCRRGWRVPWWGEPWTRPAPPLRHRHHHHSALPIGSESERRRNESEILI